MRFFFDRAVDNLASFIVLEFTQVHIEVAWCSVALIDTAEDLIRH